MLPKLMDEGLPNLYIRWPISESEMHGRDGPRFSCLRWSDGRLSDCRVNGRLVSPAVYRIAKRRQYGTPRMTPERLRFRLKCYSVPLTLDP
jgi:hypothetical protein